MAPRRGMSCTSPRQLVVFLLFAAAAALGFGARAGAAQLCSEYYDQTCPVVHRVVRRVLKKAHEADTRIYASLTRLHFHDCFVQGCDGSILLDNSSSIVSEKFATPIPRLTQCAREELVMLQDCLDRTALSEDHDTHFLCQRPLDHFLSRNAYQAMEQSTIQDPDGLRIWRTKLPTKIKFFGWLLHHNRLCTRESLLRRNIRKLEESYCERCAGVVETTAHIFSDCWFASELWQRLGITTCYGSIQHPWFLGKELSLPTQVHLDVIILILWQIWKARNAVIFEHKCCTTRELLQRILNELDTWIHRYGKLKHEIRSWWSYLHSRL